MKKIAVVLAAALLLAGPAATAQKSPLLKGISSTVYQKGPQVRIYSEDVTEPVRIFVISDTHLFRSDEREEPFRQYSDRIAQTHHKTKHFQTLEDTDPEECLVKTVALAKERHADAIALLGDMVSFPSEDGIEWLKEQLDASGIPWFYTSGNHDWQYEGMEGTLEELRETWTEKRLSPLYQGYDHKLYSVEIKGVKLIFLDNSIYEILPEQLKAFRQEVKGKQPKILFYHIPFFAPGYSNHSTAHPEWGLGSDNLYKIERRQPWPEDGPGQVSKDMWKAVLKACGKNNLLATFCGHHHKEQHSEVGPWHQFTVTANYNGGYYEVIIEPMD